MHHETDGKLCYWVKTLETDRKVERKTIVIPRILKRSMSCDATTKHAQTDESTRKFTQFSDIFQVQNLLIPKSLLKDTVRAYVHGWKIEMVVVCII